MNTTAAVLDSGGKVFVSDKEADLLRRIQEIDLTGIKRRLCAENEWVPKDCDLVEIRYKRFLFLSVVMNGEAVPVEDVDKMWHMHILSDTEGYMCECKKAVGYVLHHRVDLSIEIKQETPDHKVRFQRTKIKYEEIFGEQYDKLAAPATCYTNSCQ